MGKKRRGLLVGAGYFSDFHLDAWGRMPGAEIVCVCDLDRTKAAAAASKHGIPSISDSVEHALDRGDIDFVDVATTPTNRLALIARVLARRLPVICQKPLGHTFTEAASLMDAVDSSGVFFMVHENFRFQPWYREIKRLLASGQVGGTLHTMSMRTRLGDGWSDDCYLNRQPYFREMPRLLIHETGVHFVDTFRYLAGEIVQCSADIRKLNRRINGEDTAMTQFIFASGARAIWDAGRFHEPRSGDPRYTFGEFLVETDGGSIWLDTDGAITIKLLGRPAQSHEYDHPSIGMAGDSVYATQQHFLDALDGRVSCETSCAEYRKSLAVVEALYESARQNTSVSLRIPMDAKQLSRSSTNRRVIDLSLPVTPEMPGVEFTACRTLERDGWNATTLTLYSHSGTHMDAPHHFVDGGATLEQQELSAVCGPARVVNLAPIEPRMLINVEHVIRTIGSVEPGDRLLFRTDWYQRYGTPEYRNELPRISLELAQWLVEQQVALIGVEPPSVADVNNKEELTQVHQTLFRGGVVIVEGLAHLDQLRKSDVEFIALPLKLVGGDGSPVRAIAIEYVVENEPSLQPDA